MGEVLLERDGSVIPDQARRPSRWEEHFKDFLNLTEHPNTTFLPRDTPAVENYPCKIDPPSQEEACTAVRQLRNNRAPEEDDIQAEVILHGSMDVLGYQRSVLARDCPK